MPEINAESMHASVMPTEVIEAIRPKTGDTIVDATLGMGGHSELLLKGANDIRVIGIDQDLDAIAAATGRLKPFGTRFRAIHANFSEIAKVVAEAGIQRVDGIIADLGVSSMQFDSEIRGFSFRFDAPLDMRMDAD